MYQDSQNAAGEAQNPAENNANQENSDSDNVQDADYEVVDDDNK